MHLRQNRKQGMVLAPEQVEGGCVLCMTQKQAHHLNGEHFALAQERGGPLWRKRPWGSWGKSCFTASSTVQYTAIIISSKFMVSSVGTNWFTMFLGVLQLHFALVNLRNK